MGIEDEQRKETLLLYREVGFYKARATVLYRQNRIVILILNIISATLWCFAIITSKLSDQWKIGLISLLVPAILGYLKWIYGMPSPEKDFNNWLKNEAQERKLRDTVKRHI
ncbi:hypothetical protein BVY00_00095 [bacterium G20]|nr:hypothetical protein BVY00_00095 [bacterium G20]